MTVTQWEKFIIANFNSDKVAVIFKLAYEQKIEYTEFKQLMRIFS